MNDDNFIFINDGNKVTCGGYEIDNELINEKMPAIAGVKRGGGSIETLAVPAGLFLLQQHVNSGAKPFIIANEKVKEVNDDLYNKLLALMEIENAPKKKKATRSKRGKGKRYTRKNAK